MGRGGCRPTRRLRRGGGSHLHHHHHHHHHVEADDDNVHDDASDDDNVPRLLTEHPSSHHHNGAGVHDHVPTRITASNGAGGDDDYDSTTVAADVARDTRQYTASVNSAACRQPIRGIAGDTVSEKPGVFDSWKDVAILAAVSILFILAIVVIVMVASAPH